MAWSVLVISAILFLPLFFFGIPHQLNQTFWFAVVARLLIDSVAFTLYIKGIQLSPLSLTVPMLSLTPLFTIFTSFFINHLFPNNLGFVGVFIVVVGIYLLNFDHNTKHLLSPFKAIYKEKGVLFVTIAAVLWSFVISFQKLAIDNSNPYFYTAFFQMLFALFFTPIALITDKKTFFKLFKPKMIFKLFPAGAFDALQVFPQYLAFTLALPVYVNAVGNTSILFSSFFGWLFFKEKIHKHIFPTIIIILGIMLITFAQK